MWLARAETARGLVCPLAGTARLPKPTQPCRESGRSLVLDGPDERGENGSTGAAGDHLGDDTPDA